MLYWLEFIVCTAAIVYCGANLSKYGDVIAEKSGLGRTWIGVALMASVTSLPELITGIGSVTYAGAPDIAVGDVVGSCVFNMLIFAFLDVFYRPLPITTKAHHGNIISAGFGILLLCMTAASILLKGRLLLFGWIGIYSILFIIMYLVAMRTAYAYEKRQVTALIKELAEELKYSDIPSRTVAVYFALNAGVVIAAAVFLPEIGLAIAKRTGLGQTFVGNIFIALSTSLPEVVVSIAAVRMGAVDLAIGNLLGSNICNIGLILALDDIFFVKGPILSYVSGSHATSAILAILMTSIAIIGLTYRSEKRRLFLAWDSIGIIVVYFINLMLLYAMR